MSRKININISGTLLFTALILASLMLVPDLADAIGTASGTSITNTANSTYEDANTNNYSAASNTTTVTVQAVYNVSITSPADDSGGSNTVVYYPYTVTNTSNASATFDLTDTEGSWTGTLYADDGAGGGTANDDVHQSGETTVTASTGALAADATYKFFVAVTIPADTADGTTDNTTANVAGTGAASSATTSDQVTTTANAPGLSITKNVRNVTDSGSFATTANADPTDTLEYRIAVTNGGSVQATAVVLTDADGANTTYVSESIKIGSSTTCASNTAADDDSTQESGETCAADACGQAKAVSGAITAYLGNTANESTGGTLAVSSTVYVCFQVTVD